MKTVPVGLPRARLLFSALPLIVIAGCTAADQNSTYHSSAVAENVLTLSALPDFRLAVAPEFTYLGSTSFMLGESAQADVFYFAKLDGNAIERLVKVQVESLVEPEASDYHWEGDTLEVAGAPYILGYWCFDAAEVVEERPESDTAQTQEWLAGMGYTQKGVFVGTRLARVFAGARSEVLVFYGETVQLTGVDCNDEASAGEHLPHIVDRSDASYSLEGP